MTGGHTRFEAGRSAEAGGARVSRRQSQILDAVRAQGAVSVANLATQFDVTHQTIRRDLRALQDQGLLQKGFGAAFASPGVARHGHDERHGTLIGVKRRLVEALEEFLTPDATVYVYGGYVRNKDSSILTMSDESRKRFKFDVAVIGASAIDEQGAILEFDPMEVGLVRDVLSQSRQIILVAHDEKFGRRAPHIVSHLDRIDTLITNGTAHEIAVRHAPNLRLIVRE